MPAYDTYTTLNVAGVASVGILSHTAINVTDSGGGGDDHTVLGDVAPDVYQAPTGLFGANQNFTYQGTVLDGNGDAIGFYGTTGLIGTVLPTLFVPTGTDVSTITITLFPNNTTVPGTIWDINAGAPVCFLEGTQISGPDGDRPVEELVAGDLVLTTSGKIAPVRWIGICTVARRFANMERDMPIRIKAGALGHNLPVRDLLVSPDHALLVDDVLVHASALLNGISIVRETATAEVFSYYHVELEDHALIFAEGAPAETFVDNVSRRRFDNWEEHEALFGEGADISEMDLPRVKSARQLPEDTKRRLMALAIGAAQAAA